MSADALSDVAAVHQAPARRRTGLAAWLVYLERHRLLLAILGCYLIFGFAASLFIPPWQSPDEPAHFEHAALIPYNTDAELPEVQQPILDSFTTYRFYQYRGLTTPDPLPDAFSDLGTRLLRQVGKTPAYYHLAAFAASWTDDVILRLYSMRWLSVLFSALTIPLAYALARETLPSARRDLALLAAAFVALLPMYGYIGASVNPDTLGAPFGAAAALFAVRAVRGKQRLASSVAMLMLAGLAVWTRRSSVALLPWAALLAAGIALTWAWQRLPKMLVAPGVAIVGLALLATAVWPSPLAADWYPSPTTSSSRAVGAAYSGQSYFHLVPGATGDAAYVTHQLTHYQIPELRGGRMQAQAMVRGDGAGARGQLALLNDNAVLATVSLTPTATWQPVTLEASVPEDVGYIYVLLLANGDAPVDFDALQATNLLTNAPLALSNPGAEDSFTWWQARSLGNTVVQYATRIIQAARMGIYSSPQALQVYPWHLEQMFTSFVGRFGWMSFGPSQPLLLSLQLIALGLLAGLVLLWRRQNGFEAGQRGSLLWLALLVVASIVTPMLEFVPYLSQRTFAQGRYLFPVIAPIAVLLLGGLAQWLPARFDRLGVMVGVALLFALNLWCWFGVIVPTFYG